MPDLIKWNENYLKSTGLTLPEDMPYEEWLEFAPVLRKITNASLWWWGDYILFGERKYGEMYSQALEESDYEYQSLRNAKWVAEKFELSSRLDNLPWSFHQEVVNIEPELRDRLLKECEENKWTRNELRAAAREYKKQLAIQKTPPLPLGTFNLISVSYTHLTLPTILLV